MALNFILIRQTAPAGGGDPNYFSSSIPGFSFANTAVPPGGTGSVRICTTGGSSESRFFDVVLTKVSASTQVFPFTLNINLLKTRGKLETGSTDNIGYFYWVLIGRTNTRPSTYAGNTSTLSQQANVSAQVSVSALTCTTSNVPVALGTHRTNEMAAIGASTAPKNFSIDIYNCPQGINTIDVQLAPTSAILDTGIMELDSQSTAKGIALKITTPDGAAVPFNSDIRVANYFPGSASASLQLQAAYIRTKQAVTAGSANGAMAFTMTYK